MRILGSMADQSAALSRSLSHTHAHTHSFSTYVSLSLSGSEYTVVVLEPPESFAMDYADDCVGRNGLR